MDTKVNNWTIYMYTFPNGRKYIGATSRLLSARRGSDWSKYKKNKEMYAAIQEYGVENIQQAILFQGLMEDKVASDLESFFIEAYMTNANRYNDPPYGYNLSDGGEGVNEKHITEERRKELREMMFGMNIERLGTHPSETVKKRMSEAQWKKRGPSCLEVRQELGVKIKTYNLQKKENGCLYEKKEGHKIPIVIHNELTGETLRFSSMSSAARHCEVNSSTMLKWIIGKGNPPAGYIYVEDKNGNVDPSWVVTDVPDAKRRGGANSCPIIFHDELRNNTLRFKSISQLCEYFRMSIKKRINKWLTGKEEQLDGYLFIKESELQENCDWDIREVTEEMVEQGDASYDFPKLLRDNDTKYSPIVTHDPKTNETLRFKCVADAAQHYGLCYETVSRWVNGNQVPANGLIVLKEENVDPNCGWDIQEVIMDRLPTKKKRRATPVIVYNENTNKANLFHSIQDASRILKVNSNTISRWITGVRRPPAGYSVVKEDDWDFGNGVEVKEVTM